MAYQTMTLADREYVLIPKKDFLTLDKFKALSKSSRFKNPLAGSIPALPFALKVLGKDIIAARKAAGLTQGQLAEKLGCSQTMISLAEKGKKHIGDAFIERVLKACGLPLDWCPGA